MRFAGVWDGWKDFMDERMIKKEEEDVWRYWKWEWELIGVESVSKKKEKDKSRRKLILSYVWS